MITNHKTRTDEPGDIFSDPDFIALVEGLEKQSLDRVAKLQSLIEGMEEADHEGT
jgi:hypothetical protein